VIRAAVVAIAPEQLHAGKGVFQRREHALGSFLIRMMGSQHFDRQQVALRINEEVAFATPHFFPRIVALFRTANCTRFDGLTVDDPCAGLGIAALLDANLETQRLEQLVPDTFVSPATKVPVDGAPGREIVGQQSPRTAAAQDVEDGIDDLAPLQEGSPSLE
jgi:hypothetical protein